MSIVKVVNAIPNDHSNEQNQDSEPSIAVNPNNPSEIVLTAFTPPDNGVTGGPLYYSSDGGTTWFFYFDVPGGEPNDQSIGFAGLSNELYTAVLRGDIFKQLAVSRTDNPPVNTSLPALETLPVEYRSALGGNPFGNRRNRRRQGSTLCRIQQRRGRPGKPERDDRRLSGRAGWEPYVHTRRPGHRNGWRGTGRRLCHSTGGTLRFRSTVYAGLRRVALRNV